MEAALRLIQHLEKPRRQLLVIPRCSYCVCETGHYILIVFVVMSKEEGLCTVESFISQWY